MKAPDLEWEKRRTYSALSAAFTAWIAAGRPEDGPEARARWEAHDAYVAVCRAIVDAKREARDVQDREMTAARSAWRRR